MIMRALRFVAAPDTTARDAARAKEATKIREANRAKRASNRNAARWAEEELRAFEADEARMAKMLSLESCPGCGCDPGEGATAGCDDQDGCGVWDVGGRSPTPPDEIATWVDPIDTPPVGPDPFGWCVYCVHGTPQMSGWVSADCDELVGVADSGVFTGDEVGAILDNLADCIDEARVVRYEE